MKHTSVSMVWCEAFFATTRPGSDEARWRTNQWLRYVRKVSDMLVFFWLLVFVVDVVIVVVAAVVDAVVVVIVVVVVVVAVVVFIVGHRNLTKVCSKSVLLWLLFLT